MRAVLTKHSGLSSTPNLPSKIGEKEEKRLKGRNCSSHFPVYSKLVTKREQNCFKRSNLTNTVVSAAVYYFFTTFLLRVYLNSLRHRYRYPVITVASTRRRDGLGDGAKIKTFALGDGFAVRACRWRHPLIHRGLFAVCEDEALFLACTMSFLYLILL